MSGMKLEGYLTLRGTLRCVTGLRIGGEAQAIEIGGLDNPIIKDPLTGLPYVPGSSLKGKMRSLLEFRHNKVERSGDVHVCDDPGCVICRIFGTSAGAGKVGPGRLIVRDAYLTDEWKSKIRERLQKGQPITEIKYENTINRITARANPRQMERVPAGVEFQLEIGYRVFAENGDGGKKDRELFQHVIEGLRLVEADTLGGSGSRGYGRVAFEGLALTDLTGTPIFENKMLDELRDFDLS
jgi:CRISPR-associated protein Csm3